LVRQTRKKRTGSIGFLILSDIGLYVKGIVRCFIYIFAWPAASIVACGDLLMKGTGNSFSTAYMAQIPVSQP
jgi:hypothetical protein